MHIVTDGEPGLVDDLERFPLRVPDVHDDGDAELGRQHQLVPEHAPLHIRRHTGKQERVKLENRNVSLGNMKVSHWKTGTGHLKTGTGHT